MAKPLCIEYPGAVYYITNRGNDNKAVLKLPASSCRESSILKVRRIYYSNRSLTPRQATRNALAPGFKDDQDRETLLKILAHVNKRYHGE